MSKPLAKSQLLKKTIADKHTHGANKNTPESISLWLEMILNSGGIPPSNCNLLQGDWTKRPEVREYHEQIATLRTAVKAGNWRLAILAAYLAGEAQAGAGMADEAERERKAQLARDTGGEHHKTSTEEMRQKLRKWDKQLKGCTKKTAAMRRQGIPKSTYYKYKALIGKT